MRAATIGSKKVPGTTSSYRSIELPGQLGALLGGAHVPDHVQVEEAAGLVEVGGDGVLVDAEHGADDAPGVVVGLRAVFD